MFLFKLWIFEFDFQTIFSFLFGIVFGMILLGLIYAIVVLASLGNKKFIVITKDDTLTEAEAKKLIIDCQNSFHDKGQRGSMGKVQYCMQLSKDLAYGIASRFYPNAKYPLLEISVDETIELLGYIQKRIDELLDRRGLRLLKRIKISSIFDLSKKTKSVTNSKAFNVGKNVTNSASKVKNVLNVINPVVWLRKIFIDTTMSIITDKLCQIIIAIVGEETFKIYSKKVYNLDVSIETNVDELISSIDEEILETKQKLESKKKDSNGLEDNSVNHNMLLKKKVVKYNSDCKKFDYKIFNNNYSLKKSIEVGE